MLVSPKLLWSKVVLMMATFFPEISLALQGDLCSMPLRDFIKVQQDLKDYLLSKVLGKDIEGIDAQI
jgi:hypothetical protein